MYIIPSFLNWKWQLIEKGYGIHSEDFDEDFMVFTYGVLRQKVTIFVTFHTQQRNLF